MRGGRLPDLPRRTGCRGSRVLRNHVLGLTLTSHLILAVGLYQVAKFHVGVAIAGIAVRLFRLWRRGDDGNGFLRAVMNAGQTVLAIAFRNTLFVDYLPRAVRTDGGTDTASNTCIRRKDNLLGTCDRRSLTIPAGVAVIAFADHTVLLSDRLNIVLTTVNGRENGGNPLWNTLILRVSLFPVCIKIRQVCIDHLNGGNIVHLHPVLLGKLVNKLWKDGTVRTKSPDGEEICSCSC